ncbi:MAG: hypothetical protein R3C99_11810 [Pirellulaceae bacterium]
MASLTAITFDTTTELHEGNAAGGDGTEYADVIRSSKSRQQRRPAYPRH